jgi:hypothetical protein
MLLVLENYILLISKVIALCNDYTLIAEKVKNPTIIRWTIPIKAFILKQISRYTYFETEGVLVYAIG